MNLSPLRTSRDFRLLFTGQLVSMVGNQVTIVAISYQVFRLTHSSFEVGAISLVQLPFLVAGSLLGGTAGDAVDKRRLMMWSSLGLSALSGGIAVNAAVAHPSLVALYGLSALSSGLTGFSNPSRSAAIPMLVHGDELIAAYSINQITIQAATIVGPTAGIALAVANLPVAYGVDAVSFFAIFVAALAMSPLPPVAGAARPGFGRSERASRTCAGVRWSRACTCSTSTR